METAQRRLKRNDQRLHDLRFKDDAIMQEQFQLLGLQSNFEPPNSDELDPVTFSRRMSNKKVLDAEMLVECKLLTQFVSVGLEKDYKKRPNQEKHTEREVRL